MTPLVWGDIVEGDQVRFDRINRATLPRMDTSQWISLFVNRREFSAYETWSDVMFGWLFARGKLQTMEKWKQVRPKINQGDAYRWNTGLSRHACDLRREEMGSLVSPTIFQWTESKRFGIEESAFSHMGAIIPKLEKKSSIAEKYFRPRTRKPNCFLQHRMQGKNLFVFVINHNMTVIVYKPQ